MALVCTGFHRSGTSLAAQWLARAGLSLGSTLLPAHPSNREGHFEDRAAIELAEHWLRRQGAQWTYHDELRLEGDDRLHQDLANYLAARDESAGGAPWSVKDPRITLALPAWAEALGSRGRYLLVARHWAECASSLMRRHARELAHKLPRDEAAARHLAFWHDPTLAYRSWLAYNRRLVEFVARHRDTAALATARGLAAHADLPDVLSTRLGVAITAGAMTTPVAVPRLMVAKVDAQLVPPPPFWLRRELDATWSDLLALADIRDADEDVRWVPGRTTKAATVDVIQEAVSRHAAILPEPSMHGRRIPGAGLPEDLINSLVRGPSSVRARRTLDLAQWLLQAGRSLDAQAVVEGVLRLGRPSPRLQAMLADMCFQRDDFAKAEELLRQSIAQEANDAWQIKLARVLTARDALGEAIALLDDVVVRQPTLTSAWLARAAAMEKRDGANAAADQLAGFPGDSAAVDFARAHLLMGEGFSKGGPLYEQATRKTLGNADLSAWLAGHLGGFRSEADWRRLLLALMAEWRELLDEAALSARLGLSSGKKTAPARRPGTRSRAPTSRRGG